MPKPKLFVNHASEEKAGFVEPLVEELKRRAFPIWYDKDNLLASQSLLREIGEALNECDYGVAIFSKMYFAKKWPCDELDGLYALETATKKLIIPVLFDVTIEELRNVFPTIAGRKAIDAKTGIPRVADEIELIIDASKRIKSLTPFEEMKQQLQGIVDKGSADAYNDRLLGSADGGEIMRNSLKRVFDNIALTVGEFAKTQPGWNTDINEVVLRSGPRLVVSAPFSLTGYIELRGLAVNSAVRAELTVTIRQFLRNAFGQMQSGKTFYANVFKPYILSMDAVKWIDGGKTIASEEFARFFLALMVEQVKDHSPKRIRPHNM